MTVIAEKDRQAVRDLLARELSEDVELLLFTRGRSSESADSGVRDEASLTCEETYELLAGLTELSGRLHLTTLDVDDDSVSSTRFNVTAVPTVIIRRRDLSTYLGSSSPVGDDEVGANVRFLGLPGGYEFTTLLADIVDVSTRRTDFSPDARAAIQAIDRPVHIQVFVTPACPYCPRAARAAHQAAMLNPHVIADVIEANEFQQLSERYQVQSVPKTVINNRIQFVGSLSEAKVVEAIQKAVSLNA